MTSIFFPLASLLVDILIILMFFSKKNVNNRETRIYAILVIINFLQCLLDIVGIIYVMSTNNLELFSFVQKVDMIMILLWAALIFIYVYNVSVPEDKNSNKFKKISFNIAIIISIIVLFLPNKAIIEGDSVNSMGLAPDCTYVAIALYAAAIVICVYNAIRRDKKNFYNKKYFPLYALIIMAILGLFLRSKIPSVIFEPFVMGYVGLIMYFTIENPDLKMIEQLELARNSAEKANLAKSDFLSSMSHEIRTPLNAIVGFSEAIKTEKTLEDCYNDADDIIMASQNLLEIVNGILDISKIEANKMEIIEKEYSPLPIFEALTKLMMPRIGEKPIVLKTKFAPDIPDTLYGDAGKVKQIITNILTNAVKYTEEGQINFEVNCVNEDGMSKLVISVEDTGRGIKPEKIETLFTKFNRLDEDKNTTVEGTGLGLAITKRLLEMMGGKIVVQSKYGEGSKFTVYLAQQIVNNKADSQSVSMNETTEKLDITGKRILVVDDNKLNIKVATRLLREYNPDIDEAISGTECLDKVKTNNYDLILMDDMMPGMSGTETLHELKKDSSFDIPVVALTANAIEGMKDKYISEGFNDYLSKPIDKTELKRVLTTYVLKQKPVDNVKKDIFGPLPQEIYEIGTPISVENIENDKVIASTEENKPVEKYDKSYLEENGFDVEGGISLLGDIDMYNDMVSGFITESESRIPLLKQYKDNNDMANYAIIVHAQKSDSKYLGITKLSEMSLEHELKSKENDIEFVNQNYASLINELTHVLEICKKYIGE